MANETTTKFRVDISELKKNFQEATRQIRLANSEFKAATSGMDNWSKSSEGISAKLKQLNSTLSAQKTQLSSLEKQYKLTAKEEGETSKGAQELLIKINNQKAAIGNTEKQIRTYNKKLDEMEAESKEADSAVDDLDNSLDDLNNNAKGSNKGFSIMKGALANLVAQGINLAIDATKNLTSNVLTVGKNFESSMSNVSALSGATGKDLEMLEKTARKYGSTTQFSASEAADALGYMALAGWDAKQSSSALGGVLDLAAASGMGLAESSDMVTDYLSAFGLEAKDSSKFADTLAYAQANSNTTAQGLGEAFKNCAANMHASGQDVETTTSLLAMMANQGLKGSEAGTALTAVMRDMTAKMKNGSIQIGKTSVSVMDANGNYRDMTDILKDVEKATNGMGDAEKSSALQSTFTSNSIKGLNLILNAGIDEASNFEEQLKNCSGSAGEMANVMNNNLEGDLKSMNSAYEEFGLTIYESVNSPMRDVVQTISASVLPAFTDMVKGVDGSSAEVGKAVGGLISNIIAQFTSMLPQFAEVAVSLVTSIISGLIDSLPEIISAVIKMIVTILNSLGTMAPKIIDKVIEVVPEIVDALIKALPTLIKASINLYMALIKAIPKIIPKLVKALPRIIESVVNGLTTAIPVLLEGAIQLFMAIVNALPVILQALIPEIPKIVVTVIKVLTKNIPILLKSIATILIAPIKKLFGGLWDGIKSIWNSVATWFYNNVIQPLVKFFQGLWNGIKKIFDPVVKWFKDIFKKVSSAIHTVVDPWIEIFRRIWNKIKGVFANVVNFFKDKFQTAWNNIKAVFAKVGEFFSNIWIKIKNAFSAVGTWFYNTFSSAWKNIKKVFEPVTKFFTGIWNNIKGAFGKVSSWFNDTFSAAWQKVKDVFSKGGKIFNGIKDGILNGLKTVINGLIRGINTVIAVPFNGLNAALRSIKGIEIVGVKPFTWLNEIGVPQIPELAKGGVLRKGQVGLLEGDGAEAVVPLEKNTSWLDEIAKRLSRDINLQNNSVPQTINNNTTNNFNQNNYSPKALSRLEIYRQSKNLLSAKGV